MSCTRENKLLKIKNELLILPTHLKIHKDCENSELKTDNELSYLLEKIRLKKYRLSHKGKEAEKRYEHTEHGKISRLEQGHRFRKTKKYVQWINKPEVKARRKLYREEHKEQAQNYRDTHRYLWPKYRIKNRNIRLHKQRYRWKNDSNYKIKTLLRHRIWLAIKDNQKSTHTMELLGCSIEFLKDNLQATAIFNGYKDFDINNYSGKEYHIDHIVPCDCFNLKDPNQQKDCFNWQNLQILEAKVNIIKKTKIEGVL